MKITKQIGKTLLVMLAVVSLLPSCGKKKNDEGQGVAIAPGITNPLLPGNGSCYNLQGQTGAITVQFAGTSSGNGWYMQTNGGVGLPSVTYSRTNSAGDSLQVYVSGNQAYASATLAYTTVAAINTYAGGQLCGIYVYNYVSGGQLSSSAPLLGPNGSAIYMQYGWQNYMLTL
ncbi:MAG: hypothetical protein M9962_09090 [Oligoflexia bacterium]|nr:hypothetical protein [Oligoflexia bacterium]